LIRLRRLRSRPRREPAFTVTDRRGGSPGLWTRVHFPQLRIIGALGRSLLDWLEHVALPEEARMADVGVPDDTARRFVHALASHGTTTALVFGAHFSPPPQRCSMRRRRPGFVSYQGWWCPIGCFGRSCTTPENA
jgi:hypothetical protein